jgi:C4-dicarboxylate-specific signal transduction histidine kinase
MNTNGIGLGLVIIDNIVTKFEGNIGFYSKPLAGSEFFFTFKLDDELTAIQTV